ncbi:MAG: hypothetical protein DWQ44_04250 [Bacteroidetes bacterium]|nr:MAG: hypothetical protein DWQ33_11540 [Bacteroidota bacterium]REK00716.1 MAG: hypothetical protein DWQ39_11215 [Bacteroidota bacterium]REK35162.1 MAG: hypothetical protein DWQ44_04250 [Bacteroidota bacterium]REK48239.1 MAG: hypothetical protein DWQ48_10450 [Bacteroidota bacterium]
MSKLKIIFFLIVPVILSCTKEKKYQYEVDPVSVSQSISDKTNQKSSAEFISIAYADLFGTSIPQTKLVNLSIAYSSFGDLKLIEDRIIRSFLNDTSAQIPVTPAVNGDTALFIRNTYIKFYNREPGEFEQQQWINLIRNNSAVNPTTIYYAIMTSDEYRFY